MDSTLEPEEPITSPPWGEFGRVFTLAIVSLTGKFVLNWWNSTKISNQSTLLKLLQQRDKGLGLITVSNHTRFKCVICLTAIGGYMMCSCWLFELFLTSCAPVAPQALPKGVSLLSCSTIDDPFVLSALVPWSYFLTEHQHHGIRWALCAREICYINPFLG